MFSTYKFLCSDSQSESNHLFEKIRQQYRENASVERIMNPAKSIPIEHSYINLAIVETREQQQKERKLDGNQLNEDILGTFEEIYGVKTSIDVRNIFDKCHDYRKQVLIFGRAGIGKTTFCQYVTFKWATGTIWQQYQLIVFIRLRSLTGNRYPPLAPGKSYCPLALVKKEFFNDDLPEEDEILLKEQLEKSRVLWLLDGYDEIIQNVPAHLQYLFEQLLKMPHHILTSRPYLNTLPYDVQLEITGFTDDNIKQYVKQFFEQIKEEIHNASFEAQTLLRFLKSNLRIWGIAHIPVNLELLCSFWCNIEWPKTTAPTMTNIYDTMIEWLCRRHLDKQHIPQDHMMKQTVYNHCHKQLAFLESLAFHGMKSNSILLRPELLQIASNESDGSLESHPHLLNIGILKSLDYKPIGTRIEANKNHYFVHLSFQEYFAAQYIFKALNRTTDQKQKVIDFIKSHKYNQRFELVFTFASGLLIDKNDKQSINSFWDAILGEPLDLIGVRHVQLVIACLEETNCNRSLPRFQESVKSIVKWIDYFISKEPDHHYTHLKASLRRSPLLVNQSEILDTIKILYYSKNPSIKRNAYFLISGLPILNSHLDLTSIHLEALNDKDIRIQTSACEALEDMDEKLATAEVIDRLVDGIETSTNSFAESAIKILVKVNNNSISDVVLTRILMGLGKRPYTTLNKMHERSVKLLRSIIDHASVHMLVMALDDDNDFIKCGACRTFACMAEELQAIEVIDNLVALVSDRNDTVRQSACYALGIISDKEANIEVLDGLVFALSDMNVDVKCSACEALGRIGEKAANVKVINTLVTTLQDVNEGVKYSVCEALGRIGEKAATTDMISSLIGTAVGDQSDIVRHSAYNAIGKIAGAAATTEVISCLRSALQDVSQSIRCAACEALGRIGEKAATTEVFNGLTIVLQDENQEVRYSACIALEQMGEKLANMKANESVRNAVVNQEHGFAVRSCDILVDVEETTATDEVIIRLVSVLEDKSYHVRTRAHEALEKICTGGATKSIISKLIAALGAESSDSESSAYFALYRIGKDIATIETVDGLIDALENTSHYVKDAACRILGVIAGKTVNMKMINSLIVASRDTNEKVRESACSTLGKLGEKAANVDVINSLITAFGDENQDVRCSAYLAVGEMGNKAATTEVINNLITAVDDEIDKVSQSACYALGEIGEKSVNMGAINCLLNALRHANPNIRHTAWEALGKMECKAATAEMIKYCIIDAGDENGKVREGAYHTLEKICEKTATSEIVNCLTNAVFDKNPAIKSIACRALGTVGEKAARSKVIDSLMSVLDDEYIDVRRNACAALERIFEKVRTVEAINAFVRLIKDRDYRVRSIACFALSKVPETDVTSQMIDCLVSALDDEGIKVSSHAYETLRVICERGVSNIVINKLETALKSENYEVREYVCQLLGTVSENTVTNELISVLLDACFDEYSAVEDAAHKVVEKIFDRSTTLSFLTHDTLLRLSFCIDHLKLKFLRNVSPDKFVQGFLDSGIPSWLSIIKKILLRQGYGMTVIENTVVLYSSKEPLKLSASNREISELLRNGLSNRKISELLRNGLSNRADKTTQTDSVQSSENTHQAESESSLTRRARKRARPCTCF